MVAFVTIQEVKQLLKIDHPDEDLLLSDLIPTASLAVMRFLDARASYVLNMANGTAPDDVKYATAALVGHLRRFPDGDPDGAFDNGRLPSVVTMLLSPLRDPPFA